VRADWVPLLAANDVVTHPALGRLVVVRQSDAPGFILCRLWGSDEAVLLAGAELEPYRADAPAFEVVGAFTLDVSE
jgi:hypothetical protein